MSEFGGLRQNCWLSSDNVLLRRYICIFTITKSLVSKVVAFNPDIIPSDWLGSEHQPINNLLLCTVTTPSSSCFVPLQHLNYQVFLIPVHWYKILGHVPVRRHVLVLDYARIFVITLLNCFTCPVPVHGRCQVLPWLIRFSGVVLSCFTFSR